MRRLWLAAAFVMSAGVSFGGYSYYYTENFTNFSSNWQVNGYVFEESYGGIPIAYFPNGPGALISKVTVPDGSSDYEVRATLMLRGTQNGTANNLIIFLRASADTTADYQHGTFYAVEVNQERNYLYLWKRVNGTLSLITYTYNSSWPDGFDLRAVIHGNQIAVYFGNTLALEYQDNGITTGQPGVGSVYTPNGNGFESIRLGPIDRIGPSVNPQGVRTSSFPNHVDMQWSETDDPNGPGIVFTNLYRNGVLQDSPVSTTHSDATVAASTTYTYQLSATDFHFNTASASVTVATPPMGSIDPRRVGVRPTGTYWGAMGEQIDLLSGNLNYSLPLLKAQGRSGWSVGFNLSYNSENWRQDPAGIWNLGYDVGYGYGWKLQAGSLTPYYSDYWTLDHYTFTDATGAEYRLDQNNGGIWTSKESVYLTYDSNAQRLYFRDGSFWAFGCTSAGTEPDSGTMYPTVMEDTNGNQIFVIYDPGAQIGVANTSARIQSIEDVRAVASGSAYLTYQFTYDGTNHLTGISNLIGTAEGYTFTATAPEALYSPFSGTQQFGQTQMLHSVAINGLNLSYSFQQDNTGALTRVTLPYGGYLGWQYTNYTYLGSREQPEVQTRFLSKDGVNQVAYNIRRVDDSGNTVHSGAWIGDPDGISEQGYTFNTDPSQFNVGLVAALWDYQWPGPVVKVEYGYTWSQDPGGNPYLSTVTTLLDPGTGQVQKTVTQTLDSYGNPAGMNIYDWNSPMTRPLRVFSYSYLTDPNYISRYIYNRPTGSSVWGYVNNVPQGTVTLSTNYYDGAAVCSGYSGTLASATGQREHDDANYSTSFIYRGNMTVSTTPRGTTCAKYDMLGNSPQQQDTLGRNTTTSYSNNFAAPSGISMGSYSDSMTWSSFLGLNTDTKQNGAEASTIYDSYARPTQTTGIHGAVTTYTYTTSPPTVTATINGRWTTTTRPTEHLLQPTLISTTGSR